jgi:hypothetical protein
MKRWTAMRKTLAILLAILTLQACSTGRLPVSSTTPTAPHTDTVTSNLKPNSWSPQITTGKRHYLIHDSSTVSINNDSASRVLPIESTMMYSLSVTDIGNSFSLDSYVDSLTVSAQPPLKSTSDTGRVSEFHTTLSRQGHLSTTPEKTRIACTGASTSASSRIGELMISFPATRLKVGDKWADTVSSTSCHGKIPLRQQATREYELLDLYSCLQRDAVKVRRTVADTFTGTSTESNNHLSASGSGTSTSILCLQRDTGMLMESNGQSHSDLTVVTIRGTFPFSQDIHTHIELR